MRRVVNVGTTKVTIDLDAEGVYDAMEAAFLQTNLLFHRRATQEITEVKWSWPRGEDPRDIVDTGALRDSHRGTLRSSRRYEHEWGGARAPYAPYVHDGAVLSNGTELPPRRWTDVPIEHLDSDYATLLVAALATKLPRANL